MKGDDYLKREDRMPAASKLEKTWQFPPPDSGEIASQVHTHMEVRTEDFGAGSARMGKVELIGTIYGRLRIKITEETDGWLA